MIYSSPLMKLSAGWEAVEPHLSYADDFSVKGVLRFLAPTPITPEEEHFTFKKDWRAKLMRLATGWADIEDQTGILEDTGFSVANGPVST